MSTVAIGYCRVSTVGQVEEGVSLDAQRAKIEAYCALNDLRLVQVFTDAGVSAKRASNRPELQAALQLAVKTAKQSGLSVQTTALVVYKLDRLARCTADALNIAKTLDKAGVSLHSLTEKLDTGTAMGRFFFTLVASLAEMERNLIGERTVAALAHKRALGQRVGAIPFGFTLASDAVTLVENAREQATLARIRRLRDEGVSQRQIVARLNRSKTPTKCGLLKWTRGSLRSVLDTQSRRLAA